MARPLTWPQSQMSHDRTETERFPIEGIRTEGRHDHPGRHHRHQSTRCHYRQAHPAQELMAMRTIGPTANKDVARDSPECAARPAGCWRILTARMLILNGSQ